MWVKFHVSLLDNDAFKRLSSDARLTFCIAVPLASKQKQDGALAIRGGGPMTVAEISAYTALPVPRQKKALEELTRVGPFLTIRADGCFVIEKFGEKTGADSAVVAHRERQRRYRERTKRDASRDGNSGASRGKTSDGHNVTDKEEEVDKEVDNSLPTVESSAHEPSDAELSRNEADEFAAWFLERGLALDIIAGHWELHPGKFVGENRSSALDLVATHGIAACKTHAEAFFAAKKLPKFRVTPDLNGLWKAWNFAEVKAGLPRSSHAFETPGERYLRVNGAA